MRVLIGDCLAQLRTLPAGSVHCCVTSPPYYGLRDYEAEGQVGLEKTPDEYIAKLVEVFREVKRVLRDDGTLWLNIGDSYSSTATQSTGNKIALGGGRANQEAALGRLDKSKLPGIKLKELIGIPWMLAFALRADGWYIRQDNIWHKPNPMPESVLDRCTKAHEYLFMLTKKPTYFFDAEAIKEPAIYGPNSGKKEKPKGSFDGKGPSERDQFIEQSFRAIRPTRNKRSVWTVASKPFKEAHFAVFPPALIEPCIKASTSEIGCCASCGEPLRRIVKRRAMVIKRSPNNHVKGQTRSAGRMVSPASAITSGWSLACSCEAEIKRCVVLDPFFGAGTTALVSRSLGRDCIGIEINPKFARMAIERILPKGLHRSIALLSAEIAEVTSALRGNRT